MRHDSVRGNSRLLCRVSLAQSSSLQVVWLVPGAVSPGLFAWLLTLHPSQSAGRIYAAYGGVYIATAMLWQWVVEHQHPDRWDVLGAGVCLTGMAIIVLGPRAS
jgi:small multidrug resistance family-3 protein